MSKNAKITLTAEVRGFKQSVEDARKSLEGLKDVNLDNASIAKLKDLLGKELSSRAQEVQARMADVNKELGYMAKNGGNAFDSNKAVEYTKSLKNMKATLAEIKKTQEDIAKTPISQLVDKIRGKSSGGDAGGMLGGAGTGGGGLKGMLGKGAMRILAPIMAAVGVGAMFNKAKEVASQNIRIRQLTRDSGGISTQSSLGFSGEERRERAFGMAQAAGGIDSKSLTGLTNMGEKVERAFGVDSGTSSGFVGASRRAGGDNAEKSLSSAIGAAVAAGLEGSKISEYLSAMTGYMESLSQGVDIDEASLNGFAGALSSMPFFRNDPNRGINTIKSLDSTFQSGDAFQTGMSNRAILGANDGRDVSAASLANRRAMGLFGNSMDKETEAGLTKAGVDVKTLKTSGTDIIKNMFKDITDSTKKMDPNEQLLAFRERTGMDGGDSNALFAQIASGKDPSKGMMNKFRDAQMSPEDRLGKTMGSLDGRVLKLSSDFDRLYELISGKLIPPLATIAEKLKALFGDEKGGGALESAATAAEGVAYGAAGLGAAKMLKKGGSLAAGASKIAPKTAAKVAGSTAGKVAARSMPIIKNIMALGFTAMDAYTIYDKRQRGEDTGLDYAKLGVSAASIFDPTPATGIARMGMALIPEEGGAPATTPSVGAPDMGGSGVMQTSAASPSFGGGFGSTVGGGSSDAALNANTTATLANTAATLSKAGGSGSRTPSYAQPHTGTVGK